MSEKIIIVVVIVETPLPGVQKSKLRLASFNNFFNFHFI